MTIRKVPKPEGSTWTDDQWDAIALTGHNVLVAAAAGSGKTAVLVERIIRRISDERDPVDVDRLLVATFTKAAAAEMRHRIREAVEKALVKQPDSGHLRRQLALMGRASITTLHSFCLEVMKRYYQLIHLDPGFRIANETESELMRQDVLEELLEEWYGASGEDSPFWRLVDSFSGERSDEPLYRLIQRLYDYSRSHPWPDYWLRETAALFEADFGTDDPWKKSLLADVRLELSGTCDLLRQAMRIAEQPEGPAPYIDNLKEDIAVVGKLLEASHTSWDELYGAFGTAAFGKLKAVRGDQCDKELQEQVKELRNRAKDQIAKIKEELFERSSQQYADEMRAIAPLMGTLAELVIRFGERYKQAKAAKGLVDFADLEHFCLQILRHPDSTPDRLVPSQAALDYREQFVEVLLDEYQDTNSVQEAIVELISRPAPGNRFMVGDVKQSIYKFRLAEPGLFLDKYKSYRPDETEPGLRIDLARNFRSRQEVVGGVNYIFKMVMNEAVGEIDYDDRAKLVYGAGYPDAQHAAHDLSAELLLIDKSGPSESEERYSETEDDDANSAEFSASAEADAADPQQEAQELETAQLEARVIAANIRRMMGLDGSGAPAFEVFDKRTGGMRPATFRDFVILMRATQAWAPVFIEELRLQGIPAYAELSAGYFSAMEVEVMMSLLKVIDNPFQDIPLAAVLRSAIVGLSADELAQIRIFAKGVPFYEAVKAYAAGGREDEDSGEGDVSADFAGDSRGSEGAEGSGDAVRGERGSEAAGGPDGTDSGRQLDLFDMIGERQTAPFAADTSERTRNPGVQRKLALFLRQLADWRRDAQSGSLAELLWKVLRETGYYDFCGGMPGGVQRQANLRALYDRARQYEATSFRGLFRFLRFIERMKETGGDLGTARALGEQEDVVRIMTIHKSKGLEFPVVFVAGMAKMFNQMDLNDAFLLHKELGFGPRFADTELRVTYPTLPALAIRRRMRLETLAEEMRVLYVALTRPKEKMFLIATVKGLDKKLLQWARLLEHPQQTLPDFELAQAKCYLDWVGPAMIRHPHAKALRERVGADFRSQPFLADETSRWIVHIVQPELLAHTAEAAPTAAPDSGLMDAVRALRAVPGSGVWQREVERKLSWTYPYGAAHEMFSKTSVSELKRIGEDQRLWQELQGEEAVGELFPAQSAGTFFRPVITRRPRFLEQRKMNAAERGTLFHAVMQHVPLDGEPDEDSVRATVRRMVEKELITEQQSEAVDVSVIAGFFRTPLGRRLLASGKVRREIPFSYRLAAGEVYPDADEAAKDETILIQGVIDCMFEEPAGLVLLDFKTDALQGRSPETVKERYKLQLDLYAKAVQHIWRKPVVHKYLFLFDGAHVVEV
ncbi:helicase-exonuclease AddAB subunit AddA [Paenibacillus hamazuiensis]|uniref:helicase-exonuclease AddAB subunit AddA n=1 Tax=Paenibacillus hamazuiensis TaxID=2936508 RepID=UPI00200E5805|nr:helicase-exonuclease AddAB subunit AddA [Paenibacillus hamazuiensis]